MVKKLFKHEYYYYFRTLIIFLPVLLIMSVFVRILECFMSDNIAFILSYSASLLLMYAASGVCLVLTLILSIVRFYKNLFGSEGYLTFTLPVTNRQHLLVKLIVSISCYVVSILVVVLSWIIVISGIPEALSSIGVVLSNFFSTINGVHLAFYIIEVIILLLAGLVYSHFVYYGCITIGQTAKKNRIFFAIGIYFVYYIALQVIGTILAIIISLMSFGGAFDGLLVFVENNPYATIHIFLGVALVIQVAFIILFYKIIMRTMNNKLNLE